MSFNFFKSKRKFESSVQQHRSPIKDPVMFKLLEVQFQTLWISIFKAMRKGERFDMAEARTALEVTEKLVDMEPLRGSPWVYKSWILAALGRPEESLEANFHAIEIDPSDPDKWEFRAATLKLVGRMSEANEATTRAKKLRQP